MLLLNHCRVVNNTIKSTLTRRQSVLRVENTRHHCGVESYQNYFDPETYCDYYPLTVHVRAKSTCTFIKSMDNNHIKWYNIFYTSEVIAVHDQNNCFAEYKRKACARQLYILNTEFNVHLSSDPI